MINETNKTLTTTEDFNCAFKGGKSYIVNKMKLFLSENRNELKNYGTDEWIDIIVGQLEYYEQFDSLKACLGKK